MIDREARDRLADLCEGFARRTLNDLEPFEQFIGSVHDSSDRIFRAIAQAYTGSKKPHIEIEYMGPEDRVVLLRCALFLRSDLEYQWPDDPFEEPRYGEPAAFFAGCGGVLLWSIVCLLIDWLNWMFAAPFVWLFVFVWVDGNLSDRTFAAQLARHRREGRELDVWPYCRRDDVPNGTEELLLAEDETADA